MRQPHAHRAIVRPLPIIERGTLLDLQAAAATLVGGAVVLYADGRVAHHGEIDQTLRWDDPRPHCCRLLRVV